MKKQALQYYQSQLVENDYLQASLGLNAYRAIALARKHGGFVEAFFMASLKDYRELYKMYCGWVSETERS